jgi:RimJ/RimL family protein N-acetyltransferase
LKGAGRITVVTQGRNVAALRLFERCGFLVESSEVWLHKWYEQTA